MNMLNAEQAIMSDRQFLLQPGRLSSWFRPASTDIILKNLILIEKAEIGGYYSPIPGDPYIPVKVNINQVAAWNVTFSIRRFCGEMTVQVFSTATIDKLMVSVLHDTTDPKFLYETVA